MPQTIYSYVLAHLDPSGRGLLPDGDKLPDEQTAPSGLRFAPGYDDGMGLRHIERPDSADLDPNDLAQWIIREANNLPQGFDLTTAEPFLADQLDLETIDEVLDLVRQSEVDLQSISQLGARLALNGTLRETVKTGIALIGLAETDLHRDVLLTLGRHEEFTLYAAVTLGNTIRQPERDAVLMRLSDSVQLWGKVAIIERLAEDPSPIVQDWLLRSALDSDLLASMYCSLLAAEQGHLLVALTASEIDDPLFLGASRILSGLLDAGGPAGDISDYADGRAVVEAWLGHAERREPQLEIWPTICAIHQQTIIDTDSIVSDWGGTARSAIAQRCVALLDRPAWIPVIESALADEQGRQLHLAAHAARHHGIDPYDALWVFLNQHPTSHLWHLLSPDVTKERLPDYLTAARRIIEQGQIRRFDEDLTQQVAGPWMRTETDLDVTLVVIARFPAQGIDLVELALNAFAPGLRIRALQALQAWGPDSIPATTASLIKLAQDRETNEHVLPHYDGLVSEYAIKVHIG